MTIYSPFICAVRELQHRLDHDNMDGAAECYERCLKYAQNGSERVAIGNYADALSARGVRVERPYDRH